MQRRRTKGKQKEQGAPPAPLADSVVVGGLSRSVAYKTKQRYSNQPHAGVDESIPKFVLKIHEIGLNGYWNTPLPLLQYAPNRSATKL